MEHRDGGALRLSTPSSNCGARASGKVRLDFKGQVDIRTIGQLIGKHVL